MCWQLAILSKQTSVQCCLKHVIVIQHLMLHFIWFYVLVTWLIPVLPLSCHKFPSITFLSSHRHSQLLHHPMPLFGLLVPFVWCNHTISKLFSILKFCFKPVGVEAFLCIVVYSSSNFWHILGHEIFMVCFPNVEYFDKDSKISLSSLLKIKFLIWRTLSKTHSSLAYRQSGS